MVYRKPACGAGLLLDHLLADQGLAGEAIDGYQTRVEHTHMAVAAMVAGRSADSGLGVKAVAQDFGLQFEPIVEEDYYLVCLKSQLDREPVKSLRHLLALPSWVAEPPRLPGYIAEQPGQVLWSRLCSGGNLMNFHRVVKRARQLLLVPDRDDAAHDVNRTSGVFELMAAKGRKRTICGDCCTPTTELSRGQAIHCYA